MDEEQPPWLSSSEFAVLIGDIQSWKQSLPSWLDFSADNIYIRRESHQLGALLLIHCMYHHVICDIHRIALPELFKNQEPFVFPPEQQAFVARLQTVCFEHAQRMSILVSTILQHGIKHFADPILPSFVYNSSRIMLYYIARILDVSKSDASTLISRTVELVQQNNRALRDMSLMYPLAEPLCITSERWLATVQTSLARGYASTYIAPQDPSENEVQQIVGVPAPSTTTTTSTSQNTALSILPRFGDLLRAASPTNSQLTTGGYSFSTPVSGNFSSGDSHLPTISTPHQGIGTALHTPAASSTSEQPVFNLEDLQNFFEWEASGGENAQSTGFDGFGPLGWTNNFSSM